MFGYTCPCTVIDARCIIQDATYRIMLMLILALSGRSPSPSTHAWLGWSNTLGAWRNVNRRIQAN